METIESKLKNLKESVKDHFSKNELDEVELAFNFARDAHQGQKRKSGEDYIYHPVAAAQILADMGLDHKIIIAALITPPGNRTVMNPIVSRITRYIYSGPANILSHVVKNTIFYMIIISIS